MAAKKKVKSWTARPGKEYLVHIPSDPVNAEKCEHNNGMWRVVDADGKIFCFDPPTQVQKDIWIGSARNYGGSDDREERIKALRWYCRTCGTVQLP